MAETCHACGANAKGTYVCAYCGVLTHQMESIEDQRRALDEYHAAVSKADELGRKSLFKTGFLPDHKALVIEAGLRMVPFIEFAGTGDDATGRLEAISLKLKLMPTDAETTKAISEFEERIKAQRRADRNFTTGLTIVILAIIGALLWVFAKRCG